MKTSLPYRAVPNETGFFMIRDRGARVLRPDDISRLRHRLRAARELLGDESPYSYRWVNSGEVERDATAMVIALARGWYWAGENRLGLRRFQ